MKKLQYLKEQANVSSSTISFFASTMFQINPTCIQQQLLALRTQPSAFPTHQSPMASAFKLICAFLALISTSFLPCYAQTCSSYTFSNERIFSSCTDLPHLGASLHYNLDASKNTVSIAFKAPQTSAGWVAWGINPNGTMMVGSQAIVAFHRSDGSMTAYPTQLDSYTPSMTPTESSFPITGVAAEYVKKEMIIYATLGLPGEGTKFNQVWQAGSTVLNDVPKAHSITGENIKSLGSINFQ